jgi:Na+/melibiose symporter-like transporter
LIWAIAQDFRYFVAAALFNSIVRVSHTSWTCLMVEDAEPGTIVHIWTWVYIFAMGSAFVAPLSGILVNRLNLVPAMRILYLFGFAVLTSKFLILFRFSHETRRGGERRAEASQQSFVSLLREYSSVFGQLLRARSTLLALGLMLVMSIYQVVNSAFWSVLVTEKLLIPNDHIAIFTFARSMVMLVCFFWLTPRLTALHFRPPMALGFAGFLASQILLVIMPEKSYLLLMVSTALEAFSTAMVNPLLDSLLVITMDAKERARLTAIVYVVLILFTSPFGWIAGQLSAVNRILPFIFNIGLFAIGGLLVWVSNRLVNTDQDIEPAVV